MPNDGLGATLRLRDWCVELPLEQIEREVAAVELKGHERRGDIFVCGADVVEEAGEEVGLGGDVEGMCGGEGALDRSACMRLRPTAGLLLVGVGVGGGGEDLSDDADGCTVVVDTHAVVEGFFS